MNCIIWTILLSTVFTCAICDSESIKSSLEKTISVTADAVSIVKDVSEIKEKKKPKRRPKRSDIAIIMLPNGTFTGVDKYPNMDPDKYKYVWSDLFFTEHDKNDLEFIIETKNVNIGDIVACLMSNGITQHYAVVIDSNGTTAGFGANVDRSYFGSAIVNFIDKTLNRVPGHLFLSDVETLSREYEHKCLLITNKFADHLASSNGDCKIKLKSAMELRMYKMRENVQQIRENKMTYNLKNCNCQMIAMYLAYQYRHPNMKCYINDDIIVEQTRGTSEEAVKREYMMFRNLC